MVRFSATSSPLAILTYILLEPSIGLTSPLTTAAANLTCSATSDVTGLFLYNTSPLEFNV